MKPLSDFQKKVLAILLQRPVRTKDFSPAESRAAHTLMDRQLAALTTGKNLGITGKVSQYGSYWASTWKLENGGY